jgi:hypothetical protein
MPATRSAAILQTPAGDTDRGRVASGNESESSSGDDPDPRCRMGRQPVTAPSRAEYRIAPGEHESTFLGETSGRPLCRSTRRSSSDTRCTKRLLRRILRTPLANSRRAWRVIQAAVGVRGSTPMFPPPGISSATAGALRVVRESSPRPRVIASGVIQQRFVARPRQAVCVAASPALLPARASRNGAPPSLQRADTRPPALRVLPGRCGECAFGESQVLTTAATGDLLPGRRAISAIDAWRRQRPRLARSCSSSDATTATATRTVL